MRKTDIIIILPLKTTEMQTWQRFAVDGPLSRKHLRTKVTSYRKDGGNLGSGIGIKMIKMENGKFSIVLHEIICF